MEKNSTGRPKVPYTMLQGKDIDSGTDFETPQPFMNRFHRFSRLVRMSTSIMKN